MLQTFIECVLFISEVLLLSFRYDSTNRNIEFPTLNWIKQYLLDQPNTCTTGVQYYHGQHWFPDQGSSLAQCCTSWPENITSLIQAFPLYNWTFFFCCIGTPIIQPLWWYDPTDEEALMSNSEFLIGGQLLVAPILDDGARARNVYLPKGKWEDNLRGGEPLEGPVTMQGYTVELDEVATFWLLDGEKGKDELWVCSLHVRVRKRDINSSQGKRQETKL